MVIFSVGLVGFSDHRANLVRIVLRSMARTTHRFTLDGGERRAPLDIVIVETDQDVPRSLLVKLREHHANAVFVFVSEHGLAGDSRFRLPRKSMLLHLGRVLEKIVSEEFHGDKVRAFGQRVHDDVATEKVRAAASNSGLIALVVDDSAALRLQSRDLLKRIGVHAHEAESAERATSLLQSNSYDLALIDVVMPGVDGYELCRRVKHDPRTRRLPVLMLTSRASPFDRARGALVGCDSYLVKPISSEGFYRSIDAVLVKAFANNRALLDARGYCNTTPSPDPMQQRIRT